MFDFLIGQYLVSQFGAQILNISFETTLLENAIGTLALADSVDSAFILSKVGTSGDLYLMDSLINADNYAQITLLPDQDATHRVRLDTTNVYQRRPFPVPLLVTTNVLVQYVNGQNPNNVYINFGAIWMNKINSTSFQSWAPMFVNGLLTGGASSANLYNEQTGYTLTPQEAAPTLHCHRRKKKS
jgi:hypothetical protein